MDMVLGEKCFTDYIKFIHELTGITIGKNRNSLVESRLRKRIVTLNLNSYESDFKRVKEDKAEQVKFVDLVTTNETYFYRTPRIWDYIEKRFLPDWFTKYPNTVFTAWSAAASSGEEAHTLGILCEAFKEKNPTFHYQILGSDISQEMVGLCQQLLVLVAGHMLEESSLMPLRVRQGRVSANRGLDLSLSFMRSKKRLKENLTRKDFLQD